MTCHGSDYIYISHPGVHMHLGEKHESKRIKGNAGGPSVPKIILSSRYIVTDMIYNKSSVC